MRKFMANMAYAKELLWEFVELGLIESVDRTPRWYTSQLRMS